MELEILENKAKKEIHSCQNLKQLDSVFRKYLGRKGELARIFSSLKDLPESERKKQGILANKIKQNLQQIFDKKAKELKEKEEIYSSEWIDVTAPGLKTEMGHLHPITLIQRQVISIFQQMGFSVVLGPEIETEWYNFDALNIPKDHPARDMWNTLWLKPQSEKGKMKSEKLLLRTHTSPVQIRYMERNNPPLRIIAPGRVFRHEATDASHEINFYQIEGLMVDKDVSVANFKAIIQEFFQRFFARPPCELPGAGKTEQIKIRLRPSYFPFVEPGFEVDITCTSCVISNLKSQISNLRTQNSKLTCSVCGGTGWLEMMGAGMVHPKVFESAGLNPKNWQGFAFGMGLDRLAMVKYKIDDIRLFYSCDLRFLNQF